MRNKSIEKHLPATNENIFSDVNIVVTKWIDTLTTNRKSKY